MISTISQQGENPTIAKIREALGNTESYQTISKHLSTLIEVIKHIE